MLVFFFSLPLRTCTYGLVVFPFYSPLPLFIDTSIQTPPTTAHTASLCDPLSVYLTTYIRMLYELQIINSKSMTRPIVTLIYISGTEQWKWPLRDECGNAQSRLVHVCAGVSEDVFGTLDGNHRPQDSTLKLARLCHSVSSPEFGFSARNGKYRRIETLSLWRGQGQGGTLKL